MIMKNGQISPKRYTNKMAMIAKEIKAPMMLAIDLKNQPLPSFFHFTTIPLWDSAKGMNTPMEYNGIKRSVDPWKINNRTMEPAAKVMIPFE